MRATTLSRRARVFAVIGLVVWLFAVAAWGMANEELRLIKEGVLPESGREYAMATRRLAIAGVIIAVISAYVLISRLRSM